MKLILKYFPNLTDDQIQKFKELEVLYKEWNSRINVISRKDIDDLYLKHVLHSLSIAKFISFKKNTSILDVGTGGGFPGIPLAIIFPDCNFLLVDSINKKLKGRVDLSMAFMTTSSGTQSFFQSGCRTQAYPPMRKLRPEPPGPTPSVKRTVERRRKTKPTVDCPDARLSSPYPT